MKNLDKTTYLEVGQLQNLYENAVCLKPCSYLVMDFAEKQNLYQYISRQPLSEKATMFYFQQLVNALCYMHKKKLLCHRDLKPENFLIDANFDI